MHTLNKSEKDGQIHGIHKVSPVRRASDLDKVFWERRSRKFGHTPNGVRDVVETTGYTTKYLLWGNEIATLEIGKLTVRDTGWRTMTTKDRLNNILGKLNMGISQDKGEWYLVHRKRSGNWDKYEWSSGDNVIDLKDPTKYLKKVK
jgi:hypothetical protein